MKNNVIDDLEKEIENLYQTFAHYRLGKHIDGCPCCVFDEDQNRIRSRPLKELSAADLSKYAHKALTTWGNENNFRHFLPRLFEIIAHESVALTDPEILFGKLPYAKWQYWPSKEQQAIENYFFALWAYQLREVEPDDYTYIGSYLCGIARAVDDIEPYLAMWESAVRRNSKIHLDLFVEQHSKELDAGHLEVAFWKNCPDQAASVVKWITKLRIQHII